MHNNNYLGVTGELDPIDVTQRWIFTACIIIIHSLSGLCILTTSHYANNYSLSLGVCLAHQLKFHNNQVKLCRKTVISPLPLVFVLRFICIFGIVIVEVLFRLNKLKH